MFFRFLRGNKLNGTIPTWIINSTMNIDVSENLFTNDVAQIQNLDSNSSNLNFFSSLNSSDGGTHWEHVGYSCSSDLKYQCSDRSRLDWPKRRNICLGIAEGLAFLHESKQKNVHGNIKPTTIFLDKQDNAKISDFGFSRLHNQGKSWEEGTVVYMTPEYAKYGELTTKTDVYSFGVVVLIVVSGKKEKISMSSSGVDTEYLPDLVVREKQEQGHFMNLVDKSISNTMDWNQADTMFELALMCLDQYPHRRPTMSDVVKVLKEELPLENLKENLKQLSSGKDPQPHGEIFKTHHSKSRSTSRGGMTDTSVSVSPRTGSNA
nr:probable LRR receptor-like serine/threonine-protein kinase At1g53430 [Ipomoea batatas]